MSSGVSTPRKQTSAQPPRRHIVNTIGSWNPDATESNIPIEDFVEMKNWRKMRPDEAETRSGYSQNENFGNNTPLCKFEYRIEDLLLDCTVYHFTNGVLNDVYLLLYNKVTGWRLSFKITSSDGAPIASISQINTFLIVSVQSPTLEHPDDIGTFVTWPTDDTGLTWNPVTPLGKEVCPAPGAYTFPEEIEGDLLVYDAPNINSDNLPNSMLRTLGSEDAQIIRLPIKAPYFNAANLDFVDQQFPLWSTPGMEPFNHTGPDSTNKRSEARFKHRGCYYRFVLVQEITDASGQKYTYRSHPSTDIYVEDVNFVPPHLFPYPDDYRTWSNILPLEAIKWVTRDDPDRDAAILLAWDPNADSQYAPNENAYFTLQERYRAYFPSNAQATSSPFFYVAWYLGWRFFGSGPSYSGVTPYKLVVPLSQLKRAPMATFNWADFADLPANTVSIEVYRTAYTEVDESQNSSKHPGFRPHRYGFVGEILPDSSFTDDVSETGIDFGDNPVQHIGYLQGQFAGECMRVYEDHVVLGNVRTKTWLLDPWQSPQAFLYGGGCEFVESDFFPRVDGSQKRTKWYYSYRDADGNESNAVPLTMQDTGSSAVSTTFGAAFTFPRGYEDKIRTVVLYRAVWEPAWISGSVGWVYFREAVIPVKGGHYSSTVRELDASLIVTPDINADGTLDFRTVLSTHDPGTIIWSERNGLFEWPQENYENEHDQNPITYLETVIGPLYVFSDRGIVMTTLGDRREEVTRHVGCIGRNAAVKIDKVVFFLSQHGVYYVEGSGIRPFPGHISSEILRYLREKITNVQSLKNARRAAFGWLGTRSELWISFPSSEDLGGSMPARTFVYKFFEGMEGVNYANYELDLAADNPTLPVIYLSHTDGALFCVYKKEIEEDDWVMIIQDNDTDDAWDGNAYLQYAHPMGEVHLPKILNTLEWTAEVHSKLKYITGMRRTDGGRDETHGTIRVDTSIREVEVLDLGFTQKFRIPCSGPQIETTGYPPCIRFITEKNDSGEHMTRFKSLSVLFDILRAHR